MKTRKRKPLDLETMRTYLDDGQERAEARGRTIGRTEGIAIGEAIGETKALTAFVFSCAAMGMSIKDIAILTKLSVEQVEAILK
jgi:predicted transposase YdaD